MGNNNWGGYSEDEKEQARMEKGESVQPRKRSRRDNSFYGHMTRESMQKNYKSVKGC
jgi:hypothetical protein